MRETSKWNILYTGHRDKNIYHDKKIDYNRSTSDNNIKTCDFQ